MNLIMEIETSNVNDDFSDMGGGGGGGGGLGGVGSVSVTMLGAAQQEFKARPGLVFKVPAELLKYSASWTLFLYLSTSSSSTDVSLHGMLCPELHTQDAMTLLVLACLIAALCSAIWVFICLPVLSNSSIVPCHMCTCHPPFILLSHVQNGDDQVSN